jgi:hypothetical protein
MPQCTPIQHQRKGKQYNLSKQDGLEYQNSFPEYIRMKTSDPFSVYYLYTYKP